MKVINPRCPVVQVFLRRFAVNWRFAPQPPEVELKSKLAPPDASKQFQLPAPTKGQRLISFYW